jgi:spermidine synthase
MSVLHDAAGQHRWITVRESASTRYLDLDGCEEGAMDLQSEDPVFNYLWFHRCSVLVPTVRRALVLGAGAFTAAKCLALDYPQADIEAVDVEGQLEAIARQFFRLDKPEFDRIRFHGMTAEEYLSSSPAAFDFIFDDLFDGFQHVPESSRLPEHFRNMRRLIAEGGVCVKNLIWDPHSADARHACNHVFETMRQSFPHCAALCLGPEHRGHNRLLIGTMMPVDWDELVPRLIKAGVPEGIVEGAELTGEPEFPPRAAPPPREK